MTPPEGWIGAQGTGQYPMTQTQYDALNKDLTARLQNNSVQPALTAAGTSGGGGGGGGKGGRGKAGGAQPPPLKGWALRAASLTDGQPLLAAHRMTILLIAQFRRVMLGQ